MPPEMLLLAERLVVAMETMAQDVKKISGYVYDISSSVSTLLKERRAVEIVSVAACDGGDDPLSVTPAVQQETTAGRQYSEQSEQEEVLTPLNVGDLEPGESCFGVIVPTSIDPYKNVNVLSSDSIPSFTEGIPIEEQAEIQVNDESCDQHNMDGNIRNNISAGIVFVSRHPKAQTPVARTQQMATADDSSAVNSRGHIDERSHKCSFCAKSFSKYYNLRIHTRTHTGERPFQCNRCGKAFAHRSHLTRHMRLHTGERPYGCTVCENAFACKTTLSVHMRTHTGEKPYRCDVCEKTFRQKIQLTVHKRLHTGTFPYKCNLCGKAFRHSHTLNNHMRTHYKQHPNRNNNIPGAQKVPELNKVPEQNMFQLGVQTQH